MVLITDARRYRRESMALKYQTGEEIQLGDRVTYGGNRGVVELVVEAPSARRPRCRTVGFKQPVFLRLAC